MTKEQDRQAMLEEIRGEFAKVFNHNMAAIARLDYLTEAERLGVMIYVLVVVIGATSKPWQKSAAHLHNAPVSAAIDDLLQFLGETLRETKKPSLSVVTKTEGGVH